MHLLKSNECLFQSFNEWQLNALEQFEVKVYRSFLEQVVHVSMGLKKLFIFELI